MLLSGRCLLPRQLGRTVRVARNAVRETTSKPKLFHSSVICMHGSTIDANEVDKFSRIANHWWDIEGEFAALHSLNELRVPLIRDAMLSKQHGGHGEVGRNSSKPLANVKLLDVGCGGGILCESLARLGACVTGVDASEENIKVATLHAANDPNISKNIEYICSGVEDLPESECNKFDGVVASEIIEHVSNKDIFISACCNLVKPNGSLIITTLNKTALSYGLGIVLAEEVLRIVPSGAHDWEKFISPEELESMLRKCGFSVNHLSGMTLNPISNRWTWIKSTSINFAIQAVKKDSVVQ